MDNIKKMYHEAGEVERLLNDRRAYHPSQSQWRTINGYLIQHLNTLTTIYAEDYGLPRSVVSKAMRDSGLETDPDAMQHLLTRIANQPEYM